MNSSVAARRLTSCTGRSLRSAPCGSGLVNAPSSSSVLSSSCRIRIPIPTASRNFITFSQVTRRRIAAQSRKLSLSDGRYYSTAVESQQDGTSANASHLEASSIDQEPELPGAAADGPEDVEYYDLVNTDKLIDEVTPTQAEILKRFLRLASTRNQFDLETRLASITPEEKEDLLKIVDEISRSKTQRCKHLRQYLRKFMATAEEDEYGNKIPKDIGKYNLVERLSPKSKRGNTRYWSYTAYRDKNARRPMKMIITSFKKLEETMPRFMNQDVVGFDMEWIKQGLSNGKDIKRTISLIQFAKEDLIVLFHVARVDGPVLQSHFQGTLFQKFIEDDKILKVGSAIGEDGKRIVAELGLQPRGFLDLAAMQRAVNFKIPVKGSGMGLSRMTERYLGLPMFKDVKHGKWHKPLTDELSNYAANDAYAGYRIYKVFEKLRNSSALPIPIPLAYLPEELAAQAAKDAEKLAEIELKAVAKAKRREARDGGVEVEVDSEMYTTDGEGGVEEPERPKSFFVKRTISRSNPPTPPPPKETNGNWTGGA